jgi:serine protease Do
VLTNDHVIGGAYGIEVRLSDERTFQASVVGRDPALDIALLKLRGAGSLPAATLGSSAPVRPGDDVVVIGSPFGLGTTVTRGIISATSRPIGTGSPDGFNVGHGSALAVPFLQTDAAINPGNSGGPLFNASGQVIGVATAIHAEGRGISFAVPIDEVIEILPELRETGHVNRGRLGVTFQEITAELTRALKLPKQRGALVTEVEPDSPASRLGLKPGDVLLSVNGRPVGHARELARSLRCLKPGASVKLTYRRDGADRKATTELDRTPGQEPPLTPGAPGRRREHPRFGVLASDAPGGARIEAIVPQSPAAASLEVGDVVLDLNGAPVRGGADLSARLSGAPRHLDLLLRVRRRGAVRYLAVPAR